MDESPCYRSGPLLSTLWRHNDSGSSSRKRPREPSMDTLSVQIIEAEKVPDRPQYRRPLKAMKSSPSHGGLTTPSGSTSSPSSDGVTDSVTWRLAGIGVPFVLAQQLDLHLDSLHHNLHYIIKAAPVGLTAVDPLQMTAELGLAVRSVYCFIVDGYQCIRSVLDNWSFHLDGEEEHKARSSCRRAAGAPGGGSEVEWVRDQYEHMFRKLVWHLSKFLGLDHQREKSVEVLVAVVACARAVKVLRQPELWWEMLS